MIASFRNVVFHDSLLRPEISNKRITKQTYISCVSYCLFYHSVMKTCPIPREVLTDFAQLLENLSLLLFLNGRRPPAGDDTGALHIPSLHPSARLGNITQIEDRRNNQSCLNVQRSTGNVENKRRFLTRETTVCF